MDVKHFHGELVGITKAIRARSLQGDACAHINWVGDELEIAVSAQEPFDAKGHWKLGRSFTGEPTDAAAMIADANAWVNALPDEEDRACELIIRKLTEFADNLPNGNSDVSQAAFVEIHKMLIAKAERLSKNGLPSPNRITKLQPGAA